MQTVLVAEDSAVIGLMLVEDLREFGFNVVGPFDTCAEALAWLLRGRPDFAVIDPYLKDGFCGNLGLRLSALGTPYIVYSGFKEKWADSGFEPGEWIEKPTGSDVVLKALLRLQIRRRAYELWERAGRTGHPERHWFEAERELRLPGRFPGLRDGT